MKRSLIVTTAVAVALVSGAAAYAHHGFGRFDLTKQVHYSGVITRFDFVNPHSYLYFDTVDENGEKLSVRCEMRAASHLRRAGWNETIFEIGAHIELDGNPHRDDPTSCYMEDITIDDAPTRNRNDLYNSTEVDTSDRAYRLPSGEPNITGDWAVEQLVLTVPPEGGAGAVIPRSMRESFASGAMTLEQINATRPRPGPVEIALTEAGEAKVAEFRAKPASENPRARCVPINFIYDWTWDWPVNQITQHEDRIDIEYGLYGHHRVIHMDMAEHPADVEPDPAGHSIGRWEGDTLVVDTVGFEEGYISPPTPISADAHIVERYTLDPETFTLTREYEATDPNYFTTFTGSDVAYLSSVAFEKYRCEELTPEFVAARAAGEEQAGQE
jgi:hypothetical protein